MCRISNRVLVGFPLCALYYTNPVLCYSDHSPGRDSDWLDLTLQTAVAVIAEGFVIRHLPDFLAPSVVHSVTEVMVLN